MTARFASAADDALLTSIVLHPDVHRWNGGGAFDPSQYTSHPTNFAVIVDGGCFEAVALERAAYAIHTNFLPTHRGWHARQEARSALALAFLGTDAEMLVTMVRDDNPQALWFAHVMGFGDTYRRGDTQFMRLDIDDWLIGNTKLIHAGRVAHAELAARGFTDHDEDPVHDAYVGAARGMLEHIQFEKAERIYGRWARAAGYQPFAFVSADPPTIDIGPCLLRIVGQQITIEDK